MRASCPDQRCTNSDLEVNDLSRGAVSPNGFATASDSQSVSSLGGEIFREVGR